MRLGDASGGRGDNNLNLIRFLAAVAVLVSHSWPLTLGPGTPEPFSRSIGQALGTMAVYVFFAISGCLIPASFLRSRSIEDFLLARALRLFPGLFVALVLVNYGMGVLVTTLPAGVYLAHPETSAAILHNITLAWPHYTLPGVFEANPYPRVQGSIWTLIHEVLCYASVLLAGIAGFLERRRAMAAALLAYLLLWGLAAFGWLPIPGRLMQTGVLSLPFVLGMAFWIWRDRLVLNLPLVLLLAGFAMLTRGSLIGFPVLVLAIAYGGFWFAYVPGGRIRDFNRLGDYSYGIYIYAFPVQGLVVWAADRAGLPVGPWGCIAYALPLTLTCAVLSWHLIEAPALALRNRRWQSQAAQSVE